MPMESKRAGVAGPANQWIKNFTEPLPPDQRTAAAEFILRLAIQKSKSRAISSAISSGLMFSEAMDIWAMLL